MVKTDKELEDYVEMFQDEMKAVPDNQVSELSGLGEDFDIFYENVERYCNAVISKLLLTFGNAGKLLTVEDVMQNFCEKRLAKAIKSFDRRKKKFTSHLYTSLKQQCYDDLRKVVRRREDLTDDDSGSFSPVLKGFHEDLERRWALIKFMKGFFNILNNIKFPKLKNPGLGITRIMTYHSWELLDQKFKYEISDKLLAEWSYGTIQAAVVSAEGAYTEIFELEKNENFMGTLLLRIEKEAVGNILFTGPKKNSERNEWLRQIKDHLNNHYAGEMGSLLEELVECIN